MTKNSSVGKGNRKDLLLIVPHQNCPYLKDNCSHYDDLQTHFNQNLCEHPKDNKRHREHRTCSGQL